MSISGGGHTSFINYYANHVLSIDSSPSQMHHNAPTIRSQLAMAKSASPSPWSSGRWKLTLDFGIETYERNDNSQLYNLLGEEWGCNDARLVLPFEVLVSAETSDQQKNDSWLGGKPTGTVECIKQRSNNDKEYCALYINEKGEQDVEIQSGHWRIEPPLPLLPTNVNILPGQASTLRFYLTLNTAIQRNSITFPKEQLLLLQSNTFRTEQYKDGVQTLLPYQYAKDRSQKQLEEQLNHETGDRRLDGNDIIETLGGMKDAAGLVMERDKMRAKWLEVKSSLPKLDSSIDTSQGVEINKLLEDERKWGIWPGDTELMTIERGIIYAVVTKDDSKSNGFFQSLLMQDNSAKGEPLAVGRWSGLPMFDNDLI